MSPADSILQMLEEALTRARMRNPTFSLRAFARRTNLDPATLSQILNGKRRITPRMASRILSGLEADPALAQRLLESIPPPSRKRKSDTNRDGLTSPQEYTQLTVDQFRVLADWYYFAVLSLAETVGFVGEPEWIANRLGIRIREARQALVRLERLGLLERGEDRVIRATGRRLATTNDVSSAALRKSHFQNLQLAERSLARDDLHSRDFSSMTFVGSRAQIKTIKERIRAFRRELVKLVEETGPPEDVFQLNLQFFPLTNGAVKHKNP